MELYSMELLKKQHEWRKFNKEINMAGKQFKPRVNIWGLSKKYPTFGGEKYISYVTGLGP
jgi:hypothetical protein